MKARTYSREELEVLVETGLKRQLNEDIKDIEQSDFCTEEDALITLTSDCVNVSKPIAEQVLRDYDAGLISLNSPEPLTDDGFIYVPSLGLYVSSEKRLFGKNHSECNKILHSNNEKMPTLSEEIEFLKYCRIFYPQIYKEITEVRSPWRAEWLDDDFKLEGRNLVVYSHSFDRKGNIIKKHKKLDKDILISETPSGISLDNWINKAHTNQGFPSNDSEQGNFYYKSPKKDSVAALTAYSGRAFLGYRPSDDSDSKLGVRAVKCVKR
jgi:hypothetical protein